MGAFGLATATYGAAGMALLTSVVLTRAMSPEEFGSYRYVMAVIGFMAIVANLGLPYSAARLLTQLGPKDQPRTIAASLQLLLAALSVVALLLLGFAVSTRAVLDVSPLLVLAAALLWTTALQRHFMYMLRGLGRPREIAIQTISPPMILLLLSGALALSVTEVPLGATLTATGFAYLLTHLWTTTRMCVWGERRLSGERAELIRVQRGTGFPIYKGALISVGVAELIVVLGGAHIGDRDFGAFSLALSLAAPVATLPTVAGMVQFRRFGTQGHMPRRLLWSATYYSGLLGFFGVCAGWIVFPLVFPSDFEDARLMFPLLAVGFLFHGLGDYLNQFLQAQGDGLRIKRAAYAIGLVNVLVGVGTIPFLGAWALVATKVAGSTSYAAFMLVLTKRRNREAS